MKISCKISERRHLVLGFKAKAKDKADRIKNLAAA
jgi:hypothetical protein